MAYAASGVKAHEDPDNFQWSTDKTKRLFLGYKIQLKPDTKREEAWVTWSISKEKNFNPSNPNFKFKSCFFTGPERGAEVMKCKDVDMNTLPEHFNRQQPGWLYQPLVVWRIKYASWVESKVKNIMEIRGKKDVVDNPSLGFNEGLENSFFDFKQELDAQALKEIGKYIGRIIPLKQSPPGDLVAKMRSFVRRSGFNVYMCPNYIIWLKDTGQYPPPPRPKGDDEEEDLEPKPEDEEEDIEPKPEDEEEDLEPKPEDGEEGPAPKRQKWEADLDGHEDNRIQELKAKVLATCQKLDLPDLPKYKDSQGFWVPKRLDFLPPLSDEEKEKITQLFARIDETQRLLRLPADNSA